MTKTETKVAEISVSYRPSKAHKPIIKSSDDAYFHLLKFFPEDTVALYESFVVGYFYIANRLKERNSTTNNYFSNNRIMFINNYGLIRQLFVPFKFSSVVLQIH